MRSKIMVMLAFFAVMAAMTGIAAAVYDPWTNDPTILDDPALWLYTEGSTYNPSTTGPDWIAESWLKNYAFTSGMTFTEYVDVIAHSKTNYADNPYFFVWVKDPNLISTINVGKAHLWVNGVDNGEQGTSSSGPWVDSTTQSGTPLSPNPETHQGQTGYWVRIAIGNVPVVPDFDYGNPDDNTFDSSKLKSFVRVPITYTLTSDPSKDVTKLLIHYDAHNQEGAESTRSSTANSHDSSTVNIPEFPTYALPVGAVIGLMFLFSRRYKKE